MMSTETQIDLSDLSQIDVDNPSMMEQRMISAAIAERLLGQEIVWLKKGLTSTDVAEVRAYYVDDDRMVYQYGSADDLIFFIIEAMQGKEFRYGLSDEFGKHVAHFYKDETFYEAKSYSAAYAVSIAALKALNII